MLNTLLPYQEIGAAWLAGKTQALLADEMGLGKSCQAIRAADLCGAKSILVLCPAAARINWSREFWRFSPLDRPTSVIITGKSKIDTSGVTIASYDILSNASVRETLLSTDWDVLILDEAHYLKERSSKRAKAVYGTSRANRGLLGRTKYCWRLTGTPMPNNASELWTHLKSAGIVAEPFWDFVFRFCKGFDTGDFGYKITGSKNEEELKQLLSGFMLRRTVAEVLPEMPPVFIRQYSVQKSEIDLTTYFAKELEEVGESAFTKRLRQQGVDLVGKINTIDPLAVLESHARSLITLRRYVSLAKLPAALELLKEKLDADPTKKIVVFGVFKSTILTGLDVLAAYGAVALFGETPPEQRQRNIDRFQTDPNCRVFLGNITAAGTAITLTAADEVVFIDASWVPADNQQALKRVHRIGQSQPVLVTFISCADSVDEAVMKAVAEKTTAIEKILD